tara:strand:+ start:2496 stop:3359 length:864 start_codon:yes stop_codon:yes gene_type:complete
MKLGVITDGISRDLKHALKVMGEFNLEYAELQYIGDKEVGNHSNKEIKEIKDLLNIFNKPVSCLSRHIFAGLTSKNIPKDSDHQKHMDDLKRVIEMAHILKSPLVRIMSSKKEQILWGKNGAEKWNVQHGAWDSLLKLIYPAIELIKKEGLTLVVETGNGTMINSSYTAKKLIDDLDAKDTLKVLWDPANNCWCHELAYPNGYNEIKNGYIGHIHIKDIIVDTPKATLEIKKMGDGQLADLFEPIGNALRLDKYQGVISFESVFHPGNNNYEDGFRESISTFKKYFK